MNKWFGTGVAAIAASWLFASSASAQDLTLKCAYPFWPGFAPVYLAQELGYFKEEGLTVEETFDDDRGKLNHSLLGTGGACLLVSQFTLLADTRRGRRPDFLAAARPEVAESLVRDVGGRLREAGIPVVEGRFGARMVVRLANDGPVTIWLDSRERA